MTPLATLASRLAFGLSGLSGLAWLGSLPAQAQEQAPVPAQAAPASAGESPTTALYQDRYIGGGSLKPDISTEDGATSDTAGLARAFQIDAVGSWLTSTGAGSSNNYSENGIVAKSQWETATYGTWSLDAAARTGGSDNIQSGQGQGGVITLRQQGMPFDGDWLADNALGDLNSPNIGLARLQTRFYLPTAPMQGLATEWRGPSDLQIVAGGGVPGIYDGIVVPDFHTLNGSTATAGAQWSPASHWIVGGQFIEARNVDLAIGDSLAVIPQSAQLTTTTGLITAAWADQGNRVQMNLIDGEVSGNSNAFGGWVDGSMTQGRFIQNAGLFRIDPNLTWGNQIISNDLQGGYYRVGYQSRQWLADAGVDEVRSVSGLGTNTTFLTGDTRYQIFRDWGVGGVGNLSIADGGNSWSLEGYVDHANSWGSGRAQANYAQTPTSTGTTLTLDQSWSMPTGIRFSTSVSAGRITGSPLNGLDQDSTVLGLAAYGGGQISARLDIEGNVRWATVVQGQAAPAIYANVSLSYQLSNNWKILATYYDSQVGSWTPLAVTSPISPPSSTVIPSVAERGVFLTIRYQRASGMHFAPLGGGPGAGSGEVSGIVFLDGNNNGQLDAGEAGAPNVTVMLDGRFSVRTDSGGRFSFPMVASGHHVITVVSDNLPLPWTLLNDGRTEIDVTTRDRMQVNIAAQRMR
jgi:hypothetical protein